MTRTELIDHLRAGRTITAKVVKEVVAALTFSRRQDAELKRLLAMQSDLDLQGYEHMRYELRELRGKLEASEQRVKALEEALSPSAETKGAFMGEFSFPVEYTDRDGDEISYEEMVPWTTIKKIMKAISHRAEATCQK